VARRDGTPGTVRARIRSDERADRGPRDEPPRAAARWGSAGGRDFARGGDRGGGDGEEVKGGERRRRKWEAQEATPAQGDDAATVVTDGEPGGRLQPRQGRRPQHHDRHQAPRRQQLRRARAQHHLPRLRRRGLSRGLGDEVPGGAGRGGVGRQRRCRRLLHGRRHNLPDLPDLRELRDGLVDGRRRALHRRGDRTANSSACYVLPPIVRAIPGTGQDGVLVPAVRHLPACWRAPLRRAKACPREDVWHAIISLKLGGDEYKCVRGDATSWSAGGAVVAGKTRTAQP
jgi:hypothetical protein